jgi:pentatricopeptide repeat protein
MRAALRAGDPAGALLVLAAAPPELAAERRLRMLNMSFSARVAAGESPEAASVQVLQQCAAHSVVPSLSMYNNILGEISKKSPPEATLSFICRMRDSGVSIDTLTCNIQLKAQLARRDFATATELLAQMMRRASHLPPPDTVSFNTVISAVAAAGEPDKAEAVLITMVDSGIAADVNSYTAVISGFARSSQPRKADKWLRRMVESVRPDAVALNNVLAAHANSGDADGAAWALTAFERAAREDCPDASPDVVGYNTVIAAFARAGRAAEAEATFEAIGRARLEPTLESWTSVVQAHARAGAAAEAQRRLEDMLRAGVAPDAQAFNTVCSAHARRGDVQAAVGCLQQMERADVQVAARS